MKDIREIRVPVGGMVIELHKDDEGETAGTITSELLDGVEAGGQLAAAIDAIESMVLAHACAGIDIESPAYLEGLDVALGAMFNGWG